MIIREDILNTLHVRKPYFLVRRRIASYLSKKICVSYLVPRRNSRRNYQESLDQLWIISRLVKVFIDNYPG